MKIKPTMFNGYARKVWALQRPDGSLVAICRTGNASKQYPPVYWEKRYEARYRTQQGDSYGEMRRLTGAKPVPLMVRISQYE